jgi:pyruvate/2-oxoglutarate dehydrogenase complex dihydrolipoamide dehydrogenase (E3) component
VSKAAVTRIAIVGGGPAGYEAALVAASLGAEVTLIEADGVGGACVLFDCVPSKTLIAISDKVTAYRDSPALGVGSGVDVRVDLDAVNHRVKTLATAQSADIHRRLVRDGVTVLAGRGRFAAAQTGRAYRVEVLDAAGAIADEVVADVVLLATGAVPRELAGSPSDGERILSWRQLYDLTELPEHLVVIGSGVTGAEFASGYSELGVPVTLVSSRDRVLPGEDADAADVIERVFTERGGTLVKQARASAVTRTGNGRGDDGVVVELTDGRTVSGSHALICVGSVPNTSGLGLEHIGLDLDDRGYLAVDRVSRTGVSGVYAAGDCTGVLLLASVAAMQGRIAMWHALGEAVTPLRLKTVSANVFTHPEIATVGIGTSGVDATVRPRTVTLPLAGNARAKMARQTEGFVRLYCREETGVVIGGVIVAPDASELILPVALAVQRRLTVDDLASTFTVYPSLSGSVTEAARRLMHHTDLD